MHYDNDDDNDDNNDYADDHGGDDDDGDDYADIKKMMIMMMMVVMMMNGNKFNLICLHAIHNKCSRTTCIYLNSQCIIAKWIDMMLFLAKVHIFN